MGLIVATKAFFKLMFNRELSEAFQQLLDEKTTPRIASASKSDSAKPSAAPTKIVPPPTPKPTRSDALSLLAALQREARLLDIVNEPLGEYSDAQIGSAARDVLKNSGQVFERMFGLQPLTDAADGQAIETPPQFDPSEYRLTGSVSGNPPFRGSLAHHGWKATRCDIPTWAGDPKAAMIVAPIEMEVEKSG